ncbi:MAG: tetratricopeptide repeat protein, partial [Symploca sp. SIO2B6]|nr:tetratricopeptide repeat protein [Symploca sp. SIO2B6]
MGEWGDGISGGKNMAMWKRYKYGIFAALTALLCVVTTPAIATLTHSNGDESSPPITLHSPFLTAQGLVDQGRDRYESGQFNEAVQLLQRAAERYGAEGNALQQAIALSNLSLTHQALGNWNEATTAIDTSLMLLEHQSLDTPENSSITSGNSSITSGNESVTAQILAIQGRLQFAQGHYQAAFETWEPVTQYYRQQGHQSKMIDSQLNQTQALQALGFYKQAIEQLEDIQSTLTVEPDSPTKVMALRSLGKALRIAGYLGNPTLADIPDGVSSEVSMPSVGDLDDETEQALNATQVLVKALGVAERLGMDEAIARIAIN